MDRVEKIFEIFKDNITDEDWERAMSGIICNDLLNSSTHIYDVYLNRLEILKQENSKFQKLFSELSEEEKEKLDYLIFQQANVDAAYVLEEEEDEFCDDDEEEEDILY